MPVFTVSLVPVVSWLVVVFIAVVIGGDYWYVVGELWWSVVVGDEACVIRQLPHIIGHSALDKHVRHLKIN